MLYISDKVVAAGRLVDVITMASVVVMFSVVATEFGGARNSQKKWLKFTEEMAHNCAGDPKETLKQMTWVAVGKMLF